MTVDDAALPGSPTISDLGVDEVADAAWMIGVVRRLAGDDYAGRRVGTAGGQAAAIWLVGLLADLGASVTRDPFPITGAVRELYRTPCLEWTDGASHFVLTHRRDFAEHLASVDLPDPRPGRLLPIDNPDPFGAWLLDRSFSADRAGRAAADGAVGILVPRGTDDAGWMPKTIAGPPTIALPVLSVQTAIYQRMTAAAGDQSTTVTASVPLRTVDVTGINLYAVFTPPQPGGISVLLTAHHDGVGDDPDQRLPGAADNASGVAVVIAAARHLASRLPHVGVAVALLDGEEVGLMGAARHAPTVPAGTYVINVDGAATLDQPAAVEAGGPAHPLVDALDHAGRATGVPLRALAWRSDNRRYANAGLPTVGIGMGMPGYQTPTETPDRVQPATMTAAVRLLVATVHQLDAAALAGEATRSIK